MLEAFQKFVHEQKLFQPHHKILLAVSGGIDSVTMVHIFAEAKLNFAIAHCNFSLRGNESNEDQVFVEELAKTHQVPFYYTRFNAKLEAESQKISIQMAARALRYAWFDQLLALHHFDFLATAHHANDVLETVLMNLTRGTGIAGLHGILPKQGTVIRPILFATREEIEIYAIENGLVWREDSSNSSDKYARNLIRHKVVPELKLLNPNLEQTFAQTTSKLKHTEEAFLFALEKERKQFEALQDGRIIIDISQILALPQGFLLSLLSEYGFLNEQINSVWKIISGSFQSGKTFLSPQYTLLIDRSSLIISETSAVHIPTLFINENDNKISTANQTLMISKIAATEYAIGNEPAIGAFDLDKLHFPLQWRNWQDGDSFVPLGMKGRKKISDFLIDNKVDLVLKSQVTVLLSNDEIIWVVGMRISDIFKITPQTHSILRVERSK